MIYLKDKISIIGGDLRIKKLAEMLANDGITVYTYGLGKIENVIQCNSIVELVQSSDTIIGPIPLSSNGKTINAVFAENEIQLTDVMKELNNKTFIAGAIKDNVYQLLENKNVEVIDILKREELSVLNSISTAEGAIQIAMEQTEITLCGSDILILGFGRIGKVLAKMLTGIGANVYCEARKPQDLAWIQAYGYIPIDLKYLNENLNKFDVIINTIPNVVLDESNLDNVKKECLIIDLASNPGGVDRDAVKKKGIQFIWALALPGKVAPVTSAKYIKETIYNILED
jgi:dipicolinate synthase subunit A